MLSTFVLTFVLQVPARLSHYQHRLPIRAATLVVKASVVAAWCINFGKFCAVKCAMACDMVRVESLSLSFHDYSRTVFDILSLKISASFLLFLVCNSFEAPALFPRKVSCWQETNSSFATLQHLVLLTCYPDSKHHTHKPKRQCSNRRCLLQPPKQSSCRAE